VTGGFGLVRAMVAPVKSPQGPTVPVVDPLELPLLPPVLPLVDPLPVVDPPPLLAVPVVSGGASFPCPEPEQPTPATKASDPTMLKTRRMNPSIVRENKSDRPWCNARFHPVKLLCAGRTRAR